jgi:hypothetical protein
MTQLAEDIATSRPGAKPFAMAWSTWAMMLGASAWTAHNLSLWFGLEQSTETTVYWAMVGLVWVVCQTLTIMRRHDIKVPDVVVALAESILEGAPKS